MKISKMKISHYDDMYKLWQKSDGVGIRSIDDSLKGITKFLQRNPNTCYIAIDDNNIIGTILAGHDGRRGYIYHLLIDDDYRQLGYGRMLVNKSLESLKAEGINKVALVVFKDNIAGNKFWEKLGFIRRDDLIYRNLSLNQDNT